MRENEMDIFIQGSETVLGKKVLYILLHIERKKWYSMTQVINLEIGPDGGGEGAVENVRYRLFGEETSGIHLLLKCTKTKRWREEFPNNKWPNINEEIALRKLRTCNKYTELRNISTLHYTIKCKWENQMKKTN